MTLGLSLNVFKVCLIPIGYELYNLFFKKLMWRSTKQAHVNYLTMHNTQLLWIFIESDWNQAEIWRFLSFKIWGNTYIYIHIDQTCMSSVNCTNINVLLWMLQYSNARCSHWRKLETGKYTWDLSTCVWVCMYVCVCICVLLPGNLQLFQNKKFSFFNSE
jgi:hypothetical protein